MVQQPPGRAPASVGVVHEEFPRGPLTPASRRRGQRGASIVSQEVPCPFPPPCRPCRSARWSRAGRRPCPGSPAGDPVRSARPARPRPVRARGGRLWPGPGDPGVRVTVVRARWTAPPRSGLPDAGEWSGSLVVAVVQALLGPAADRPAQPLAGRRRARPPSAASSGSDRSTPSRRVVRVGLHSVRVQHPHPEVAEVAARVAVGAVDHRAGPASRGARRPMALYGAGTRPSGLSLGCGLQGKSRPESGDHRQTWVRSSRESNR